MVIRLCWPEIYGSWQIFFTLHKSFLCYSIMQPSLKSTLGTRQNQEAINKMTKSQATIPCIHSLIQKSYVLIQFNDNDQ